MFEGESSRREKVDCGSLEERLGGSAVGWLEPSLLAGFLIIPTCGCVAHFVTCDGLYIGRKV